MKKLLLVGGGGHCKAILDSLLCKDCIYDEIGIIDISAKIGQTIYGIKIIGDDDDLQELHENGFGYAFVSLGSIGKPYKRMETFCKLKEIGFSIPIIRDPSSIVSQNTRLCEGTYIGKRAVINCAVQIGSCAIINTGSLIEHDCVLGDFVHAAPGSILCGGVKAGNAAHIGAGAVVMQNIEIGQNALIGAGTVVIRNVADNSKVVGNPGRILE